MASWPAGEGADPARLVSADRRRTVEPESLGLLARRLEPDLLAAARRAAFARGRVIEREGCSLLSLGTAARIQLPFGNHEPGAGRAVADLLARIAVPEGAGAARPVALGALPFDPRAAGELVVPAVTVLAGRAGEAPLALAVGTPEDLRALGASFPFAGPPEEPEPPRELPDRFELTSSLPHAEFRSRVAQAVAAIEAGELEKVVLAREVVVRANRPFQQGDLLRRLRALHPSCLAFALDGFVGASPELLCRREGTLVRSEPLAGTVARSGDPEEDARLAASLLASPKERREHRFVVEAIRAALLPYGAVSVPEVPVVLELRNVAHLATPISGQLEEATDGSLPGALELALALHPTPAVGGWPRKEALEHLVKLESLERGRYAGPVGYVDAAGDGEWWLGIRSAQVEGRLARLVAGVGIVEGSDPAAELVETQLKLQALLAVAVRP